MKYNLTIIATALLLSTLLSASSCKKDNSPAIEQQLPPETHTGAFTFGCKVDGKIYTASSKGGLLSDQHVKYNYVRSDSSINVFVGNTISKFNLDISINYKGVLGMYTTRVYPYIATFYDNSNGTIPGSSNTYTTDLVNLCRVNIKYFFGSSMPMDGLSGTFEMDAINANGKVIHITEGRFDIGF